MEKFIAERKIIERLNGEVSFIAVKNGEVIYSDSGRGVKPVLSLYETSPETLNGASVYDSVIGRAAAVIFTLASVKEAYGAVMSEGAREWLDNYGIHYDYGEIVPTIKNRSGTDVCPLEKSVLGVENPREGLEKLKAAIAKLSLKGDR